jgi:hypothetical protein
MANKSVAGGRPSLSKGMLVEARVIARLLGLKLLTVDATVALLPVTAASKLRVSPAARASRRDLGQAANSGRGGLGEAVRRLDEGTEVLERARRNRLLVQSGNGSSSAHPAPRR